MGHRTFARTAVVFIAASRGWLRESGGALPPRRRRITPMRRVGTWLAAIAWFTANGLFAAEGGPSPVFTNKVRFRIPFRYDAAEMRRLQASEVQLFLSIDQGTRWRMIDKVDPKG